MASTSVLTERAIWKAFARAKELRELPWLFRMIRRLRALRLVAEGRGASFRGDALEAAQIELAVSRYATCGSTEDAEDAAERVMACCDSDLGHCPGIPDEECETSGYLFLTGAALSSSGSSRY